jgi:hypothetical protein
MTIKALTPFFRAGVFPRELNGFDPRMTDVGIARINEF